MFFRKIAALAFALCAATAVRAEDCQLRQIASLEIVATDDGMIVPVTLEGKLDAYMTLELPGLATAVDEATAKALGLRRDSVDQNVDIQVAGQHIWQRAEIGIRLGGSKGDAHVGIIPSYRTRDPRVVGVLGMDVLNRFDVELDLAHGKMNLFAQDHCHGQVVYWTRTAPVAAVPMVFRGGAEFVIPMTLDGKAVDVELATGPAAELDGKTAHDGFGLDNADGDHTFKLLAVDGLGIANPKLAVFRDDGGACTGVVFKKGSPLATKRDVTSMERCYGRPELTLGYPQLMHLRIFLAYRERMMYATAADAN